MIPEGTKEFSPVYSAWLGKSVVLLVVIRQCHIPMPCSIVGESVAEVRIRIKPGLEMRSGRILLIILLVLLFGGGGGYYGYSRWGTGGGMGIVGTVLLILLVVYLVGGLR